LQKSSLREDKAHSSENDQEASADEDKHFRKARLPCREKFVQFKNGFAINDDSFENTALRTANGFANHSQYAFSRSISLNTDLDEYSDICEVCNYREKMGRKNRRRPSAATKLKFTKREIILICLLGLIDFIGFCSMSVMAPFFPREVR
jgi:hypothetical protein